MIKFAIVIATYHRPNGNSPAYLKRSIQSVIKQTHTEWTIIIVSDKYEPESELINIIDEFRPTTKNEIVLLKNSNVERDHIKNHALLWNVAGATSMNMGLEYARSNGFSHYCHLDDDDYWDPSHLESLRLVYAKFPNCIFANTKSTYRGSALPAIDVIISENNYLPAPCGMIHSAISFRCDIIGFSYYTTFTDGGVHGPSDADMLNRIRHFILHNPPYSAIYVAYLTCHHDIECERSY